MLYLFRTPRGKVVEEYFPATAAPKLFSKRKIRGVMCTRIPSSEGAVKCLDVTHEAVTFVKGIPGAPRYSKDGFPVFVNKQECVEFSARYPRFRYDPS